MRTRRPIGALSIAGIKAMKTRSLAALIAVGLLILVAGVALLYAARTQVPPTIVLSSSPSPTATAATANSTPVATPLGITHAVGSILLDVAVGPGYEQPAATTPGVGGATSRGPTSVASDGEGRIYL